MRLETYFYHMCPLAFFIFEKMKFEQSGVFGNKIAINKIVKQNLRLFIINYKLLSSQRTNSLERGRLNSNFDAQAHGILTLCCLLAGGKASKRDEFGFDNICSFSYADCL